MKKAVLLGFFLLLGLILGQLLPESFMASGGEELRGSLLSFTDARLPQERLLSLLPVYFRCPLALFAVGFCPAGGLLVPLILTVQGFALSYCGALLAASVERGLRLALVLLGIRCLFLFPAALLVGAASLQCAVSRTETHGARRAVRCFALSSCILCAGAWLEGRLVPELLCSFLQTIT